MMFVIWGGLCIFFPEFMYRTNSYNSLKKKPKPRDLKRFRISGYVMLTFGVALIVIALTGGFGI